MARRSPALSSAHLASSGAPLVHWAISIGLYRAIGAIRRSHGAHTWLQASRTAPMTGLRSSDGTLSTAQDRPHTIDRALTPSCIQRHLELARPRPIASDTTARGESSCCTRGRCGASSVSPHGTAHAHVVHACRVCAGVPRPGAGPEPALTLGAEQDTASALAASALACPLPARCETSGGSTRP